MTEAEWDRIIAQNICRIAPDGSLVHPGLPFVWGLAVWASMLLIVLWGLIAPAPHTGALMPAANRFNFSFSSIPGVKHIVRTVTITPWLLTTFKIITASLFLTVIWAGLVGTPLPERNLATVLTWNLWWSGVIISVFFMGSAWCAVCPWDALSSWLVKRKLWRRAMPGTSLDLRVPKVLRNVWPALVLLIALTWLELGVGITKAPYATAVLALAMLVLATVSLAVFERKAFCRFACPVGRTIGFYAQLAPVELRPRDTDICATCTTLECYHGSAHVDPCPTHQVMGRLKQNTFCTSCGNCARSCPHENVTWRVRPPSREALQTARPHWDEAWFMLGLLALTGFHGLTMMEFWEKWIRSLARVIGDTGQLLWSFSIGMGLAIFVPVALYCAAVAIVQRSSNTRVSFREAFTKLSFVALPLAFAYHLAHNLAHLLREGIGAGSIFASPLGTNASPLSLAERQIRMTQMALSPAMLAALQALLIVLGFFVAVLVIRRRGAGLLGDGAKRAMIRLTPMFIFATAMTAFHLWLLMQPMIMRM